MEDGQAATRQVLGRRGAIYVATGDSYRSDAERSAASLKKIHPDLPICLFSDKPSTSPAFDHYIEIRNPHRRSKLDCLSLSPFEETLFLDTDTRVIGPVDDAFDLLQRFDLALAHMKLRHPLIQAEKGYSATRAPSSFYALNSGVLYYRLTDAVSDFLTAWATQFKEAKLRVDQLMLRELLWQHPEISFYVLPWEYNARELPSVMHNVDKLQPIRVLHFPLYNTKWSLLLRLQKTLRKMPVPGLSLINLLRIFRAF